MLKTAALVAILGLTIPYASTATTLVAPKLDTCHPAPSVQDMLLLIQKMGNSLDHLTPTNVPPLWEQREQAARNILNQIPMESVKDLEIPARNHQIPVRIYTPKIRGPFKRLAPIVFYHGGGWTLGSLATYDSLARKLAKEIPAIVISVDYRLAPENPFPAATDDAYAALDWTARNASESLNADVHLLSVAGDSGGGNLATVTALRAGQVGLPLAMEILFYPSTNISSMDTESYRQFGKNYLLTQKSVESFRSFYLPNAADQLRPEASPLLSSDAALAKLPATYMLLVGCDPLLSEGLAYGQKIKSLGVPVELHVQSDMVHGFMNFFNGAADPPLSKAVEPILIQASKRIRSHLLQIERNSK